MSKPPLSLAKITKPRPTRVITRERLFRLMDHKRQSPALWVTGPAGSGKTTLVADYLAKRKVPCLWYQIDSGDADIATFFYYMGLAAQKAAPRVKKRLPLFTPEYGPGLSTFTLRYFEAFFDRLKRPAALVLDNYQEAGAESPLHKVIRDAVSVVPEGVNIIVASRSAAPPILIRSQTSGMLDMVGWDELGLNVEETRALLEFITGRSYSEVLATELHQKTNGWVAGLLLFLKTKALQPIGVSNDFTPEEVFEYFASEIFEDAVPAVQNLLLETAFFPAMTGSMALELTGISHAEEILNRLVRNHDFTEKRINTETTYHYHPLFREFLLNRAKRSYPPSHLAHIKQTAAKLLEHYDQSEAAIPLYLESEDWGSAVGAILGHAQTLVYQGRHLTLDQWLKRLPTEVVAGDPWLLYWEGMCKIPIDPAQGISSFETALGEFKERGDLLGSSLALGGILYGILYCFSSFRLLDRWIPEVMSLVAKLDSLPSAEIEAQLMACMMHSMVAREPVHPDFDSWEVRALSLLEKEIRSDTKVMLLIPLLIRRVLSGDLKEAELLFTSHRRLLRAPDISPLNLITVLDLEACYAWYAGKFALCRKAVVDALKAANNTGVHLVSFFVRGHGCGGQLSEGNLKGADRILEEMRVELHGASPWGKELFHALVVWRALLGEDFAQAVTHSELALRYSRETGEVQTEPVSYLGRAISLNLTGRVHEASEMVSQALELSRRAGSRQVEYACQIARAEIALDKGDEPAAEDALAEAFSLAKQKGYVNAFYWRPAVMTRLCVKALEAGIEPEYVIELVRQRDLVPEETPLHLDNWPWPLRVFTLGRFRLQQEGKIVQFPRKGRQKPVELLKVLISLGGMDVSEGRVTDALWPEADGDMARRTLYTTLHRLRKLAGRHEVVQFRDGRLTLDRRCCWVDIWAFEGLVDLADRAWERETSGGAADEAVKWSEKALALYRGPFAAGEDTTIYAVSMRERLREKFIRTLRRVGEHLQGQGKWQEAAECYQRGLEREDLAEPFYQGLMVCYQMLGRRSDAMRTYLRCKKTLAEGLGVGPSPATEAVLQSIQEQEAPEF